MPTDKKNKVKQRRATGTVSGGKYLGTVTAIGEGDVWPDKPRREKGGT